MNDFFNRLVSAYRVLFVRRVLLIEAHRQKDGRDSITIWGTVHSKADQITILRALADSIEVDRQQEERTQLLNLSKQKN
jgi:hypothetical protein